MTKKLLASLIALSMLTVCACSDDDKDDDSCEKVQSCKVDNGKIKICINKKWTDEPATAKGTCTNGVYSAGSGNNTKDPSVGTDCNADDYQAKCINNNANALVCQSGKVAQWDCANNGCKPKTDNPKQVDCPKAAQSTTDKPSDVPATCVKSTDPAFCASDGNAWFCGNDGYYLNSTGTCTTAKPCQVCPDGFGGCTDNPTEFCKDHQKPETCVYGDYAGNCDGDTAKYCSRNGQLKTSSCNAGACVKCTDGYVGCSIDCSQDGHDQVCTGEKVTEGGTDGNCCDIKNYTPECKTGNKVTYCDSVGKVKTVDCNNCSVTGKEYSCPK